MNLTFDILELANEIFSDISKKHNLTIKGFSQDIFLLLRCDYRIFIGVDHDGIYASFFNTSANDGYDLLGFLLEYRRDRLTFASHEVMAKTHREYVAGQFSALARHLVAGGQDILNGEDDWKKIYRLPFLTPPKT